MCDASDYAVRAVLGQRKEKHFQPIHYASKTMSEAQENYTITEKELLDVVFAFKKFHQYLVLSKTIVSIYHSALRYVIRRALRTSQPITFRLENPDFRKLTKAEIRDLFHEEQLMTISDKGIISGMSPSYSNNVWTKSYEDVSLEMRQRKSFDNVIAARQEGITVSPQLQGKSSKPDSTGPISFAVHAN
ncbi:reverse transcriptase domain-containing protein [Tanacetum coccineum]|uniref:Reverse transcriptase domain-containing protein n=1 Tax=Tanacetum coccineum TaxID=301880 RepID=A0ABQ5IWR2_9ASTR